MKKMYDLNVDTPEKINKRQICTIREHKIIRNNNPCVSNKLILYKGVTKILEQNKLTSYLITRPSTIHSNICFFFKEAISAWNTNV